LLDVDEGSPILLIRRHLVNSDGVVCEILQARYRGDRLQYHIQQGSDAGNK
jgi:DNA-binding GntR family transcriptional regulator